MLLPISITSETINLDETSDKVLQSTVFFADFGNGLVKSIQLKRWWLKSICRDIDLGFHFIPKNESPLYHLDWSNNPLRGTFEDNYPSQVG